MALRKTKSRCRRAAIGASLLVPALYLVSAAGGGCAGPVEGLWPPGPGERTHRIVVSADRWHSTVGLWPPDDPGHDWTRLEEWGYAEKGFYLEGDAGSSGALRALLVPSQGTVQVVRAGRPWSERTPQPPARQWSFSLSEAGYRKLREFLEGEMASARVISRAGGAWWYEARASYHAFHHCHHWTARALRAAGLPVWSFYALFKWTLEAQLDRTERFLARGR